MSIRNKLVVSNMLMVIIPVAIITAVILLTTLSITYFSTSKMSFDPSFGSYLLYKTQFNVSSLEDKIKTPKKAIPTGSARWIKSVSLRSERG